MADRLRDRALRGGLLACAALLRRMGPTRHRIGDAGGLAVYAFECERRRRTAANHRRQDPQIDAAEAARRARASYREYGRSTVDFIWACGMDDEQVRRVSEVRGMEHIDAARGSGGILALTHHGNWDMAANIASARGLRLTTVMAPMGAGWVTDLVSWARRRNQLEVFTPSRAARGLLRALERGRFIAILADIPGGGPETIVDYCGGPVIFSRVPAWLALRTGAPLLPVTCVRRSPPDPPYVIIVHPPLAVAGRSVDEVMQMLATTLEAPVHDVPEQWYPFGAVYADVPAAEVAVAPG